MNFNKADGAGTRSFKYGSYSNHKGGKFKIQKSVDNGTQWADVSSEIEVSAWTGTFNTFSVNVNESAAVRFRLVMTVTIDANTQVNIDDFMVTDYGTAQVAMPTSSIPTGVYETSQAVTLSTSTPDATIYYTTDGTAPTTSSNVYSTPYRTNQLVRINSLNFTEAIGTKTFAPNTPYTITDTNTSTTTTTFRTPSMATNLDYNSTVMPATRSVIAVVAKNSTAVSTHTIFARSLADFIWPTGIQKRSVLPIYIANGKLYFEIAASQEVKIFSATGQQPQSFLSVRGKNSLELSKGIYVLRIGKQVAKVVL